jgi:uncharacterized membrane protein YeiH
LEADKETIGVADLAVGFAAFGVMGAEAAVPIGDPKNDRRRWVAVAEAAVAAAGAA